MVLDTSVLVAALRSQQGASNLLVEAVLTGRIRPLLSVPLVLEYEAVLKRPDQLIAFHLTASEVDRMLVAICTVGVLVQLSFRWRPQLNDPDDEMILDTAVNGSADAIVSYNRRDFEAGARFFGIQVLSPAEAWRMFGRKG